MSEINDFVCGEYNTTFPRFDKVDVNGEIASPLFKYLKSEKRGLINDNIKWNFTKFLVDKDGNVTGRYAPNVAPEKIEKDIAAML
jgi:glutathione peroxidase